MNSDDASKNRLKDKKPHTTLHGKKLRLSCLESQNFYKLCSHCLKKIGKNYTLMNHIQAVLI